MAIHLSVAAISSMKSLRWIPAASKIRQRGMPSRFKKAFCSLVRVVIDQLPFVMLKSRPEYSSADLETELHGKGQAIHTNPPWYELTLTFLAVVRLSQ